MLILIAGPYRSGTNDDPLLMKQNLDKLESVALTLFRAGHIPMIGEWLCHYFDWRALKSQVMTHTMKFFIQSRQEYSPNVMLY